MFCPASQRKVLTLFDIVFRQRDSTFHFIMVLELRVMHLADKAFDIYSTCITFRGLVIFKETVRSVLLSVQTWEFRFCFVLKTAQPESAMKNGWFSQWELAGICAVLKVGQKQPSFRTWDRFSTVLKFGQNQLFSENWRESVQCWKLDRTGPSWKLFKA